jgi:phage shock protein PspC (stress-responsive transcriptional regulator)
MSQNFDPNADSSGRSAEASPPPPRLDLGQELRSFRRSRNDRVIAGVCGGIAERLRLDPVLVRVLFAASVLVGGVGVLVYALAWLLMPEEDTETSLIDEALGRRNTRGRGSALALSILLILVAFVIAGAFVGGDWGGPVLIILAIVAVFTLLRRDSAPEPADRTAPPPAGPAGSTEPDSAATGPVPGAAVTQPVPTATTQQIPAGSPPPPVWRPAPAEPRRPRARSPLFWLVISTMLVVLGGLALADVAGAGIARGAYFASALAVVGLGLLVGAWWGRSRGLIALGVILALALPMASAADAADQFSRFHGRTGRVAIEATTIEQGTGTYEYGAGEVIYDLTRLDFSGQDEQLNIDMGGGSVQVSVPPEVDLVVDARVGVGELRILDRERNGGFGVETSVVDHGTDGPGGGQLRLNVDNGFGEVVVSRAAA